MIRELIVVEGIHDASAVRQAVDAEVLCTGGFMLSADTISRIRRAARHIGVIVLTDPDHAGEQIRRRVGALAPGCKHAHVSRTACTRDADVGIENAAPDVILAAIERARPHLASTPTTFTTADLHRYGLVGAEGARDRRRKLGDALGLGYANARQLLRRLNHYGVGRAEMEHAMVSITGG